MLTSLWPERLKAMPDSPAGTASDYALSVLMVQPRDAADKLVFARLGMTCNYLARTVPKQELVCFIMLQIKSPAEKNRR